MPKKDIALLSEPNITEKKNRKMFDDSSLNNRCNLLSGSHQAGDASQLVHSAVAPHFQQYSEMVQSSSPSWTLPFGAGLLPA